MKFRKSKISDIDDILVILKEAQEYFKSININQWSDGYPGYDHIKVDIDNNSSYVLIENDEIIGTTALCLSGEPTYDNIYNGKWLTGDSTPYGVIHRMAVKSSEKGRGLAQIICNYTENICKENNIYSMRIDTHMENKSMQRLIEKVGYKYCGNIFLNSGIENYAYEKLLGD